MGLYNGLERISVWISLYMSVFGGGGLLSCKNLFGYHHWILVYGFTGGTLHFLCV